MMPGKKVKIYGTNWRCIPLIFSAGGSKNLFLWVTAGDAHEVVMHAINKGIKYYLSYKSDEPDFYDLRITREDAHNLYYFSGR